jgi:hypothetical protein
MTARDLAGVAATTVTAIGIGFLLASTMLLWAAS